MSDIVERLRGIYRVHITDGLGKVDGNLEPDNENEFVRQFPSPPIQIEAADEIERLRTLLSEAEQRERDARTKALEEAAKVADTEEELPGDPPQHITAAMLAVGPVGNARSAVRTTKANIAKRIRALQSEER